MAKWSKSIINHFWWCCRTCESEQGTDTPGKLTRTSLFLNKCAHPPLSIHQEEDVEWLEANYPDFQALEVIVLNKGLSEDLGKLTEFCHTGQIDVFHYLINNTHRNAGTFSQQVNMLDTN